MLIIQTVRHWVNLSRETLAGMIAHRYGREKLSLYADEPVRLERWEARVVLNALRVYEHNSEQFQYTLKYFGFDSALELAKLVGFAKGQILPDQQWPKQSWYDYYQEMYRKAASQESPHTTWVDVSIFLDRSIYSQRS